MCIQLYIFLLCLLISCREETAAPLVSHRFVAEGMSYDLTLVPDLKVGVTYTLMLVARNDIGDSEMSNSLTYTKSKDTTNSKWSTLN